MIEIKDKKNCCGCSACYSVCPTGAITMEEDEEGFRYPKIDKDKCINCHLCEKVCPIATKKIEEKSGQASIVNNSTQQRAYVVNNKDEQIRRESTAGGAFSAIAKYVIEQGGVVFGATFDKDFNVHHTFIDKKEEIYKFRGSKYVQSNIGESFKQAKEFLDNNKMVCFSGTPCQIEGLKKYLRKEYDNLITIDVVCRAVPSPLVWRKYLEWQDKKLNGKIEKILFRDKSKYGYKYPTMTIKTDKEVYKEGVESDPYLRSFFNGYAVRPSCLDCQFKKRYRVSDITIWDCFEIEKFDKKLDDDKGTTRILIQSLKGEKIFDKIKEDFYYSEINPDVLVANVVEMFNSADINAKRGVFFEDLNKGENVFDKYFPNSLKARIQKDLKIFLAKTNLYKPIKRIVRKIKTRNKRDE